MQNKTQKNIRKIVLYFIVFLIVVILILVLIFILYKNNPPINQLQTSPTPSEFSEKISVDTQEELSNKMKIYKDDRLDIEISVPIEITQFQHAKNSEEYHGSTNIPVIVIPDYDNNSFYIVGEYEEYCGGNGCEKEYNTLDRIKANNDKNIYQFLVKSADSVDQIEEIIEGLHDNQCSYELVTNEEQDNSSTEDVVHLKAQITEEQNDGSCPYSNYSNIIYDKKNSKVLIRDNGNGYTYILNQNNHKYLFDFAIENSIKFL